MGLEKGVQDRRDAGGPVSPSGPQSSSAEKCEVRCIGHAISAVCQASRGVQRFVEPARLQVCAHAYDVRGALSGAPGSQCLQSKAIIKTAAALRRQHPGTIEPRRRVTDMLLVATGQVRHPLLRFILMKTDDRALRRRLACDRESVERYDLLRTVNDAGRAVSECRRCHQGRRRWTRAINCWTP